MKIAIVNLTNGGLCGGYKKYLSRLMPLIRNEPLVEELTEFFPPGIDTAELGHNNSFRSWAPGDQWKGFVDLKTQLNKLQPDVIFIPTGTSPGKCLFPMVIMPQNMEMISMPLVSGSLSYRIRNQIRNWVARRACQNATSIIAISEHVYNFLNRKWKIDLNKLNLIYFGADEPLKQNGKIQPDRLFDVKKPFIFTAGVIVPYRGLEDIIISLAEPPMRDRPHALVIAGEPVRGTEYYQNRMIRLSGRLGVKDRIIWAGQLNPQEMAWCYSNGSAFVMSSRIEACPNTALEAMSYGCQIVSTDVPPMPEIFGNCAGYYPVLDSKKLAEKLTELLSPSPSEIEKRRYLSINRSADFSWTKTAKATVDVLWEASQHGKQKIE